MKVITTKVSLTLKQAQELVNAVYARHDDQNHNNRPARRNFLANQLIELLILPVGRPIGLSRDQLGYTFDYDNTECKSITMSILYTECQTAQHIATIFLNSSNFADFRQRIASALKYVIPIGSVIAKQGFQLN